MQAAEIELKFPIADIQAFQRALPAQGFHLETERTFEANTLYDTPARELRQRHQLLRIRTYGDRYTLTHKRTAAEFEEEGRFKTRIETETTVDDPDALAEVLVQLGYEPVFRYEKFRTEWSDPTCGGHLVLDETAIGTWAELEGSPQWIDATLARLGVDPNTTLTASYGKLFTDWCERTGSTAQHLTFDCVNEPQHV